MYKTYKVDFQGLTAKAGTDGKSLNKFEREVYNAMRVNDWAKIINRIDMVSKLGEVLTTRQLEAFKWYAKWGTQEKVADEMKISQEAVSQLLNSAFKKVKSKGKGFFRG